MKRYNNIDILKNKNGNRYFKTVKYPIIEKSTRDLYIVGKQGDRLDNLAHVYYKDTTLWWIIARANNIGKGDLTVPIGKQIRIPLNFNSIVQEYRALNR
jgi:nucleoid-associated protein YgaU